MDPLSNILLTGAGATAFIDVWALERQRLLGIPLPNYGLVGRRIGHWPRGKFRHGSMSAVPPVRGELALGWAAHYLTGIAFSLLLYAAAGSDWFDRPTLAPALQVGVATVAAPFLIMQPAMGAGIAASRTPQPLAARLQSLITHGLFGLGLFLSALAMQR